MSYLDILNRAKESPTTDYFLGLLQVPDTDLVHEFFARAPIVELRNKFISVTQQLELESRNKSTSSAKDQALIAWERVVAEYSEHRKELNNFQQHPSIQVLNEEFVDDKDKAKGINDLRNVYSSEPMSDFDYLRSLIGIFEFDDAENDSENVENIVLNVLQRKHTK